MGLAKSNETEAAIEEETTVETSSEAVLEPETEAPQSESKQVAATSAAPPATTQAAQGAIVSQLEQSGFGGLEIDWTSFPTIVLNQGEFETSDGNALGVDSFTARMMQSRKRYVLRTKVADDDDAELAYTYDLSELSRPDSELALKVSQWKEEEGLDYDIKEYIESVAMVEDENCSLNDEMVIIQIPPTSIGRFSGFLTKNALVKKQEPSEYLTRFSKGDKVTKAKKPFYPWAFEYAG